MLVQHQCWIGFQSILALLTESDGSHCNQEPVEAAATLCKAPAEIHKMSSIECHS